jgi:hypothetical protein
MHKAKEISRDLFELIIRGNQQERDAALSACHAFFNSGQKEIDEAVLARNLVKISEHLKGRVTRNP